MCDVIQPTFPLLPQISTQLLRTLRSDSLAIRKLLGFGLWPFWIPPYLVLFSSLFAIPIHALLPSWSSNCESQPPSSIPSFSPGCVSLIKVGPLAAQLLGHVLPTFLPGHQPHRYWLLPSFTACGSNCTFPSVSEKPPTDSPPRA